MLLSSAPLRVSFFGGGSDLKQYYSSHGGAFLSCGINSRMYVAINTLETEEIKLSYSETEITDSVDQIKHPLIRESLKLNKIRNSIEIGSFANLPTKGTGLGSSSSFSVALLGGLKALKKEEVDFRDLAEQACHLEIELCKEPIGKQDQYAATYGGLNFYKINYEGEIEIENLEFDDGDLKDLASNFFMVFTGVKRSTKEVLTVQKENLEKVDIIQNQKAMVGYAYRANELLKSKNFDSFGALFDDYWNLKKNLADVISNSKIDSLYNHGKDHGALGGKLLGAGSGGYLLFYVPQDNHDIFLSSMKNKLVRKLGISREGFRIDYRE
tara:strand:+ start:13094 stop:14071 length:978 start_codon:yes stop_codon:yes gene_type:complete